MDMAYLADMHIHSIYSYDGQMRIESVIKRGLELGLKYLAFTEHIELDQITLKQVVNRYKCYCEELEILQEKYPNIKLIKGMEVSNPERHIDELQTINNLDLDYILGSNHLLPKEYSKKEVLLYYKRILQMVKNGGIDAVAHLDYIRRRIDEVILPIGIIEEIFDTLRKCNKYIDDTTPWALAKEENDTIISNDIALEINSSASRRINEFSFPNDEKLKLYQQMGGSKVTIGSDAHRLNEVFDNIENVSQKYDFNKGIYLKRKFISCK